jgi:hypothetical protein
LVDIIEEVRDAKTAFDADRRGRNVGRPGSLARGAEAIKADDMKSDPAGNAGDRIACGLIAK